MHFEMAEETHVTFATYFAGFKYLRHSDFEV